MVVESSLWETTVIVDWVWNVDVIQNLLCETLKTTGLQIWQT